MKKLFALLLAAVMVFSLVACTSGGGDSETTGTPSTTTGDATTPSGDATEPTEPQTNVYVPTGSQMVAGKEYGTDYISLYEQFGDQITIADVYEDPTTGLAYVDIDGETYELGMDFLSMAMVYKCDPAGDFTTEDEVYAEWWKYYITRWNMLLPEVPLYSNEYYDIYNAQIGGIEEHPTNPFWGAASALIDWTSSKEDSSIIIGSSTELSGKFRYATFGGTSPGGSDLDIQNLTLGLETVTTAKDGSVVVNPTVTKDIQEVDNEDGSRTYTITLHEDLKFSDGSPVTAKNYLYSAMVFSTPVAAEAAGRNHQAALQLAGYENFAKYDGTNEGVDGATKELSGLRLLGDYQFSVTVSADYMPYFYALSYASFSAAYKDLWMGEFDIKDDGNGCYIDEGFYAKEGDSYTMAKHIKDSAWNTDNTYPYSGPYTIASYDESDKSVVLTLNPNFKGNYEGTKPTIEKVIYKRVVPTTQMEDLRSGGLDFLSGVTGGAETDEAIALCEDSNGAFSYIHYSRAGYGKLAFRCDYGPAQFPEVRQAVTYCIDRPTFAKSFTGGYGGVVDGPYYTFGWMYKMATDNGMLLNTYDTSVDAAIEALENGGWIYNADGTEYTGEGVRYKMIPAEYITENDKNYKSMDGAYYTTEVDGNYYMPLVLNWYGSAENPFSDLLVTNFVEGESIAAAGFKVYNTFGDFQPMLDEYYQQAVYGFYSGTPMFTNVNFATTFNSTVYDFSFNWTVDPGMYDDYSSYYCKDAADIYWLK